MKYIKYNNSLSIHQKFLANIFDWFTIIKCDFLMICIYIHIHIEDNEFPIFKLFKICITWFYTYITII